MLENDLVRALELDTIRVEEPVSEGGTVTVTIERTGPTLTYPVTL